VKQAKGGGNAVFVDWLTATEYHPEGGLPLFLDGVQATFDAAGNCRFERALAARVVGSYDTSVRVRCDGFRVSLIGNPGRFSRPDNLFNFGWLDTWAKADGILEALGLPAFRDRACAVAQSGEQAEGARVSRIDVTGNYAAGSDAQARAVIRWLSGRSVARMKRGFAGDESVWFSNTRHMLKAYRKGAEMKAHGGMDELIAYAEGAGIVRVEVELKRRLLGELGLDEIGNVTDQKLADVFREQTEVFRAVDRSEEPDIIAAIPARYRTTAAAWLAGQDIRMMLSNGTLYRQARILREYGIDILEPRNIKQFPVKVRVVELEPLTAPSWYDWKRAA